MTRRHLTGALFLAAFVLALAGCGGSSDSESAGTTTTTTKTKTTTTTTTTSSATTTEAAPTTATTATKPTTTKPSDVLTIGITVVDAKPKGGIARPTVAKGTHVVLVVHSDTADEVHLHGYDLSADVDAGGTARIPFVADTPGRFDVELENLGVELAEITVN